MRVVFVAAALCSLCSYQPRVAAAAEVDTKLFVGTWKLNLAKTNPGADMGFTISEEGGGLHCVSSEDDFTIKDDGQSYPAKKPTGATHLTLRIGDREWRDTEKQPGKDDEVDTYSLSTDGQELTIAQKIGTDQSWRSVFSKLGASSNHNLLVGRWEYDPSKSESAGLRIEAVQNGLKVSGHDLGGDITYTANFDGRAYPAVGPAKDWDSVVLEPINARTYRETKKKNGETYNVNTVEVSADGKTLVIHVKNPHSGNERVIISDRQ